MEKQEMKPEIGVGGGGSDGSPTDELVGATVRRIVVPIVYDEDEEVFEFCIDQMLNGDYKQSRTALKCLIGKKCGKQNLQGLTAVVENKAQLELNNQQKPSTSQAEPPQTQPKCTQEQLDCIRKYREQLKKKSPTKYQKVLNKANDFYNQRWTQMSDVEKSSFNLRILDRELTQYNKVAVEKKQAKNRKSYQRIKNDEIQMEKLRARIRRYKAKQKATESDNKYKCKFCGKSFVKKCNLVMHECSHLSIKPFSCTWANCQFSAKQRYNVVKHVRTQHFKLPKTKQQQQDLNIVDIRDPNDYIRENKELTKRRLE